MRDSKFRYGTLVVGLLVAVAIIFSQTFSFSTQTKPSSHQQTKTADASNETESSDSLVTISITSLPSSPGLSFTQDAVCLFEILFLESADAETFFEPSVKLNKFFSTLLSVIISPNAP